MSKSRAITEELCPLPTEEEENVEKARAGLLEIKHNVTLRQLFARMLVRLDLLERRIELGSGASRRLRNVDWMPRRSDAYLTFKLPGSAHEFRMRLALLRSDQICALCSADLHSGMYAYHAGWKTSTWLRHLRVCYECGQKKAPAPKAEDLLK